MGFGHLRVINEDEVEPGAGFETHGHRDMEIVSYVVDGALEHKDTLGNGSLIRRGEVQRMSAGTGIRHSEYNPSDRDRVRFLQIWIVPEVDGLEPSYAQKAFTDEDKRNRLRLVVSPDGRDGSLGIHQDVRIYASVLDRAEGLTHPLETGRRAWLQVIKGTVRVADATLESGDGAGIDAHESITVEAVEDAEFLLFDLA